jgi:hypothetical protein
LAEWQQETYRIFLASQSQISKSEAKILQANTAAPTIGALTRRNAEQAKEQFLYELGLILVICGIKEPPDPILKGVLWTYACTYLQGYTFEDLKLAFLMNASGELGQRVEVKHYGLFDVAFISQVMAKYLESKIAAKNRAITLLPLPVPEPVPTDEELYNGLLEYCRKYDELPEYWNWAGVFAYMDECLLITETMEQRRALYNQQYEKLRLQLELDIAAMTNAQERHQRQENLKPDAQAACRKLLVKKYLRW